MRAVDPAQQRRADTRHRGPVQFLSLTMELWCSPSPEETDLGVNSSSVSKMATTTVGTQVLADSDKVPPGVSSQHPSSPECLQPPPRPLLTRSYRKAILEYLEKIIQDNKTENVEVLVTQEWDRPTANRWYPRFLLKLYAMPSYANDILQVPPLDAPVVTLQSLGIMTMDSQG
uniref:Uncharacterized protein n=1 Tax=Sphaerodactylus townsendi TaxID=933632 RepID=A0ACB8G455_9SAUR